MHVKYVTPPHYNELTSYIKELVQDYGRDTTTNELDEEDLDYIANILDDIEDTWPDYEWSTMYTSGGEDGETITNDFLTALDDFSGRNKTLAEILNFLYEYFM